MAQDSGDVGTLQPGAPTPDETLRPRLGAILVRGGRLTPEQLEAGLMEAVESSARLGEVLVRRGWMTEEEIAQALAEQFGLRYVDAAATTLDPDAVALVPAEAAERIGALPLRFLEDMTVYVVVADPTDARGLVELRRLIGRELVLAVGARSAIEYAIGYAYRPTHGAPRPAPEPEDPAALLVRLVGLLEEIGADVRRLRELREAGVASRSDTPGPPR